MFIAEFAKRKREIVNYLTNGERDEWLTHLLKIQIFDSDEGLIKHWEHEVYSLFNNIPKVKNTNQFPSKEFIFKTLWDHYGDRLFTFVDKAQDDEPNEKLKMQLNFTQIFLNIKNYFDWVSNKLSKQGRINSDEVYNKLWEYR